MNREEEEEGKGVRGGGKTLQLDECHKTSLSVHIKTSRRVNLGSGSDQRRQKHGDVQTCQMWCYGYFFGTL